jgi:hypothetical protein
LLVLLLLAAHVAIAAEPKPLDPNLAQAGDEDGFLWYDAKLLPIEGQGWLDTKFDFSRLPGKAEGVVRSAVWNLSLHSSGIVVRFFSNATTIHVSWTLISDQLAMPHMPATGVSGLDLYVRDSHDHWRWLACPRPAGQSNTLQLVSGIPAIKREYMLYLPLYNGISSLEIGIPKDSTLFAAPERPQNRRKPIVFYGTSITQGCCASRPGMTHPAILGRRFDRPIINLGFSGNGRMEIEVVKLIREINAAVYVIDCLPNIDAEVVEANTKPCIEILRKSHPATPILLVEDRSYANSFLVSANRERNLTSRAALRKIYNQLKSAGDKHLYYLEGENLLGDDNEGTVDSSHPSDLGFMRQADAFAKVLGPILDAQLD